MAESANRNQRVDATIPVRFTDAKEFLVEYTSNISLGGVFVRTSSPSALGSVVRLSLELPGTSQSIPVTGQVAFVLPADQAARQGKVPGMGVRFARLDPSVQDALAAYVEGVQKQTRGRVLLVDDDPVTLQQIGDLLRAQHFNVTTVSSAVKALEIVRFGGIDLILSDIEMARMDGFEFRDNLRGNPRTSDIAFVYITKRLTDSDRKIAGELGVQHFLSKPTDDASLMKVLRAALGSKLDERPLTPPPPLAPPPPLTPPPPPPGRAASPPPSIASRVPAAAPRNGVEETFRRFTALGLDTRLSPDERGVFGQLVLKEAVLQDPLTGIRLERAGFYAVGPDRVKPFWPRALAALPMMRIADLKDARALEMRLAETFNGKMQAVRGLKEYLEKWRIPNRWDPITMRVLGQARFNGDELIFSVRDPETLFLETWNGRSFGEVAPSNARFVDVKGAREANEIAGALEKAARRLLASDPASMPEAEPPNFTPEAAPELPMSAIVPEHEAPPIPRAIVTEPLDEFAPPPRTPTPTPFATALTPASADEVWPESEPAAAPEWGANETTGDPTPLTDLWSAPADEPATGAFDPAPAIPEALESNDTTGKMRAAVRAEEEETGKLRAASKEEEPEPSASPIWAPDGEEATPAPEAIELLTADAVVEPIALVDHAAVEAKLDGRSAAPEPAPEPPKPAEGPPEKAKYGFFAGGGTPPAEEAPRVPERDPFADFAAPDAPAAPGVREADPFAKFAAPPAPEPPAPAEEPRLSEEEPTLSPRNHRPEDGIPDRVPEPDLPPEELEARRWADEWNADVATATPLWTIQPGDDVPPANAMPAALETTAEMRINAAADEPSQSKTTPMLCNSCGKTYFLGDDVADERLLLLCPDCVKKQS